MICARRMRGCGWPGRRRLGGAGGAVERGFPGCGRAAGSLVAGYRVEEPLGAGGMAVVYRARDERLRRLVALKVLAPALAADEEFRWRFTAESRAAAAVDHPHIIPVYEAGQAGHALFIAMRLVTGGDLLGVLAREGPLAPGRAAELLSPVASALDAAHGAGLVHRDVKPANVLVDTGPGRPEHVYLSDFGISKAASSAGLTGTGQFLGTPEYASPEQARGWAVDGRSDQYALACVAWRLLTGTVPFQRDQGLAVLYAHLYEPPPSLDALRPDLPAAAGQVLARAMAKDPGERYLSCGEFADALRDALAFSPRYRGAARAATEDGPTQDAAPGQRPPPGPGPDRKPARRRRYLTLTLAGMFLATATAIAVLLATPGASQPHAGLRAGTPTPAASNETPRSTPAASGKTTKPPAAPRQLTTTLAATLANPVSQGVRTVAFASGGTILAAGDFSGDTTYLWNTTTRKITATLPGPGNKQVEAVAFAPHSATLAVGDLNGSTYLWDTTTRKITATLTDHASQGVRTMAFAPDGTTLAVGDSNGRTYLWDIASGLVTIALSNPLDLSGANAVAFARDSTTLAVGCGSGTTYVWNTATSQIIATLPIPSSAAQVNAVAFSPDGTIVAVGDFNGRTYLWDRSTGTPATFATTLADPASHGVNSVAFSPDGTMVAVGDQNGRTYLWDTATGKLTATLTDPR